MPKRKDGEGSFDKIEKGGILYFRWRGTVGYAASGKRVRKEFYARTDRELRAKVKAFLAEVEAGTADKPDTITVADWCKQWLDECCRDIKPTSREKYESHFRAHIVPALGAVRLKKLSGLQVQRFVNNLSDEHGLSPKTVSAIHGLLHEVLKSAVNLKYISSNPAENITLPRKAKHEANFIADEDLKALVSACAGDEYGDVVLFAVFTGIRIGELLGLCWDCVDFDRKTISIKRNLQYVGGSWTMQTPKSDKERILSPAPFVFDLLRKVRREQLEMKLRMGTDWIGEHDLVFSRYDGCNLAGNTVRKHFKKILESAGLSTESRFHDLRHSYVVFAYESGDDFRQIQAALGHYSPAFTATQYHHITDQTRKESAERQQAAIDDLLHG